MSNLCIHKILYVAVTIGSCFFMQGCENDVNEVKALGTRMGGIDVGKEVTIYISADGKINAKLMAPVMNRYLLDSGRMTEFPNAIRVDFFKDSLTIESKLFAKYGNYSEANNIVFLRDEVVVYNMLGDTLWCKEMYWDQNTGMFHTEKEVTVKQHNPVAKIYGIGLEATQNLSDIRIFKPQPNSFAIINDSSSLQP